MKNKTMREKVNVFIAFVFWLCGGDYTLGSPKVGRFCIL